MYRWVITAAMLPLVLGCAVDHGGAVPPKQTAALLQAAEPARQTYALGTALNRDGAVTAQAAGDTFIRGGEVFLSVNVESATTDEYIEVIWYDAGGNVTKKDARHIPESAQYAPFSSGATAGWASGHHRAVIIIDGREVAQLPFGLVSA